jgi:hypothetical protein
MGNTHRLKEPQVLLPRHTASNELMQGDALLHAGQVCRGGCLGGARSLQAMRRGLPHLCYPLPTAIGFGYCRYRMTRNCKAAALQRRSR